MVEGSFGQHQLNWSADLSSLANDNLSLARGRDREIATALVAHVTGRTLTGLLWLAGAVAAFALGFLLVIVGEDGTIHAWALIAFFWSAALLAGAIHHFPGRVQPFDRYRCGAPRWPSLRGISPRIKEASSGRSVSQDT